MSKDKIAFLVLAHKDIDPLIALARNNTNINFYIHFDLKFSLESYLKKNNYILTNIFFIDKRVSINWAGFSMVEATLNLINYAIDHSENNEFFHLISGEDIFLIDPNLMYWESENIIMEYYKTYDNRYRMRYNFFYADTKFQRSFFFKVITQIFKKIDSILPCNKEYYCGSQWFSIRRTHLKTLLESISDEDKSFFKKKLCPDEHFFQYLISKCKLTHKVRFSNNMRYIRFDPLINNGSSPIYLNFKHLREINNNFYWFARKVKNDVANEFYTNNIWFKNL